MASAGTDGSVDSDAVETFLTNLLSSTDFNPLLSFRKPLSILETDLQDELRWLVISYLRSSSCPDKIVSWLAGVICASIAPEELEPCEKPPTESRRDVPGYNVVKLVNLVRRKIFQVCGDLKRHSVPPGFRVEGDQDVKMNGAEKGAGDDEVDSGKEDSVARCLERIRATATSLDHISFSSSALKNKRAHMEDVLSIIPDLSALFGKNDCPCTAYCGVFDGHSGAHAALFAASHLHRHIVEHELYGSDLTEPIRKAFVETDRDFCERFRANGGSTGLVCVVREKKLYLGWLGDSEAMLYGNGGSHILWTPPHRPNDPSERARINAAGGCVTSVYGTWRVMGTLAISRAIGDWSYKECVSSEPDVKCIDLDGSEELVILASDGLWDTISHYDAYDIVMGTLFNADRPDLVARELVKAAKEYGSTDNITAVVVFLQPPADIIAKIVMDLKASDTWECSNKLKADVDEKKNGFSESDESDGQAPMRFFKPWRRGNNDHGGPEEKSDMEVGLSLTSNVLSPDSAGFYPEHSSVQPGFPNTVNLPGDLPEVAEEDEEERKQLEMFGVGTGDLLRVSPTPEDVDSAISAIDSVLLSGNDLAEPVGEPLSDDDWSYKPGGGAGGAEEDDDDEEEETVHEETNPFRQQEASHVMLNPLATEFIPGEGMSVAPEFLQHMKTVELEQHPAERASEQVETKHAEDQVESCDVRKTSEEISPFEEQVPKELEAITSEPVLSSVDDEDDVVKEAEMDSAPERLVDPALDEASVSETEVEDDFVHVPPGEQGYVSEPVIEPVFVPEPMSEQAFVPQPVVEEPFVPEPVPQEEFVVPQPMVEESFIPEPLAQEAPFVPEPLAQEAAFVPEPLAQEAAFVPEPVAQEAAFMPEPLAQEAAFVPEPLAEDAFVPEPVAEDAFVLEPVTEHVGLPEPVVDEGFVSEPVLEEAFEPVVVEQDVSDPVHTEPIVSEPVVEQEHISVAPFEQEFVSESVFGQEFTQKPVEHDLVEDAVHEPVIESNIAVEPADHSFDNRDFIDEDIVQQEPVPELLEDSLVHSFEETLKISAKAENPFESHQRVFGDENGEVLDHEELVQPVMNNLEHPEHREVVSEFQELEIEFQKTSFDHRESIDHQEKVQEIQEPRVEDPVGFQQPMFDILESDHVEFHQEVDNQESNPVEFQRPVFEIEEPVPAEVQPPTFQLQEPEKLAFEVDEQHFKQPDIDLLPTLSGAAPGIRHVYSEACASSVTMPEAMMMRSDELEDLMHVAPEVNIHSAETNLEEVSPAPETEMTSPAPEEEPVHVAMEAAPDVVQEPEPEPVAAPDVVPEPEPEVMRKAVKSVASKAPLKKVIGKITPVASKASPTAAAKPAPIKKAVGVAKPAAAAAPAGAKPPGAAKPSAGVTKSVSKTATGVAKPAAPAAAKPATAQKILGTGAQKPTTSTVHKPTTSGAQKTAVSGTAQKPVTAAQKPAATGPPKLAAPKPARPVATGAAKPAAGMTRPVASAAAAGAKPAVAKSPASAGAAAKASARPTPTAARPSTARPSPSAEAKPKTLARPATATTAKPKSATASPATAEKKKPSPAPIRRPVPKKD